jgi:hypothetical protein
MGRKVNLPPGIKKLLIGAPAENRLAKAAGRSHIQGLTF